MPKKIFNSDLETSGTITASTLNCRNTSGIFTVNGSLTSDSLSCEGDLDANSISANIGYLTSDKTDSTTDRLYRHSPSVYARQELTSTTQLSTIQSLDTISATFHATVGPVTAFTDYGHAAVTLRSDLDPSASTEADYFTQPRVGIRTVSLESDASSSILSSGIVLAAQIGQLYGGSASQYTELHVRSDKVRVNGDMEVTGTFTNFTGAHTLPVTQQTLDALTPGMCLVRDSAGNAIPSSSANSSSVVGIFVDSVQLVPSSEDESGDKNSYGQYSEYTAKVAAVGDSRTANCPGFNVCNENGDIQPGDLLVTSSTPGYLMKQDDDIIRSKTVGKAMEPVTFDDNGQATGVYGFIYCG